MDKLEKYQNIVIRINKNFAIDSDFDNLNIENFVVVLKLNTVHHGLLKVIL